VKSRELLVDPTIVDGWSLAQAAEAAGVSDRTAGKWVARNRSEGSAGLADRSSVPVCQPTRTPEDRVAAIAVLRRVRLAGSSRLPTAVTPTAHGLTVHCLPVWFVYRPLAGILCRRRMHIDRNINVKISRSGREELETELSSPVA